MCHFYITLLNHSIMQSSINLLMTKQMLYLFNRHTFIDGRSSHCTPEFMRMNMINIAIFTHLF